MLYISDRHN